MTQTQDLFNQLYMLSKRLGFNTYADLPPKGVAYPIVVIGEVDMQPIATKHGVFGRFNVPINVWSLDRKSAADTAEKLLQEAGEININGLVLHLNWQATSMHGLTEEQPGETLYRRLLELEYRAI